MERTPITVEGYEKLQHELSELLKVERPKIIEDIETARAHGDLKENAEYIAAREKQSFIEGRIQTLNSILSSSEVIDPSKIDSDKAMFGATVAYENIDTGKRDAWKIVGEQESDISSRKISFKSPIARALIGKQEGDEAKIKAPKGIFTVEIISVEYI